MKRLLLFLALFAALAIGALLSPIIENPAVLAQTNTFCAANLACNVTANWNFKALGNIQIVDSTLSRGGTDIGNEINLAYAALPANGGAINIYPKSDGTCYSYSTGIAFTTASKYVTLRSIGSTATGSGGSTQGGACLNFTVTGSQTPAIAIDIPPSGQTQGAVYGLENIHLINNGCLTTGGCGSNAFGVSCGSTNLGCTGAHFDNVSINGFLRAFDNRNANSSNFTWNNPQFVANQTIGRLGNNTGNIFVGGTMAGNGSGFVADAAGSAFSLDLFGVQFFGNGGVTFDCTNVTGNNPCIINGYDLHLEASPGGTPHFAQGDFDLNLHGGVAEDDVTVGSTDWMFNCSGSDVIVDGTVFTGGGRTITNLVLLNSPCRAMVRGEIKAAYVGKITGGICGGANASFCTTLMLNGPSTNAALPFAFESPLTLNGVGTAHIGNTVALTADWTCGTGGTVASCVAATIIGSGGGVPLTFTLPLVAQSYTLQCDGVVGQATAATANQWNLLTATNGATNVTADYAMATAATAAAYGAVTDQASTTTTFQIAPSWTLGGTATKMPFHIWAKIEGASASGTVVSLQLVAPTVGDLVTIYRGTSCRIF